MSRNALLLLTALALGAPSTRAQDPGEDPRVLAFRALGEMGLNAEPAARLKIVRQLFVGFEEQVRQRETADAAPQGQGPQAGRWRQVYYQIEEAAVEAVVKVGLKTPEAIHLYAEALKSTCLPLRQAASIVLGRAEPWRQPIRQALSGIPPQHAVNFYAAILPRPWGLERDKLEIPGRQKALEIARAMATEHEDPQVRAISLSFAILKGRSQEGFDLAVDLLRSAYTHDRSLIVRRAALRIAGFIGQRPGNLDLPAIVAEEKDLDLLKDAIEARGLWSMPRFNLEAFELIDGVVCDWLPDKEQVESKWNESEVARLERIVLEEKGPQLRDAASSVLAGRNERSGALQSHKVQDLKVHEWGVWRDAGELLAPAEKALAELPPFVHRSQVAAEDLWEERSYHPMAVFKPVLYFYAPRPLSLNVQVDFFEGRPWTFFPRPTDYQETTRIAGWLREDASEEQQRLRPFADREGMTPEWIKLPVPSATPRDRFTYFGFRGLPPVELRSFHDGPAWAYPGHDRHATDTGQGPVVFTGMGIEWSGLRVGYEPGLESSPPSVEASHWWSALREVPASLVSVRGETERFLFYDGAVNVPAPVTVAWEDESHAALQLSTRRFGIYPETSERQRELWGEDVHSDTTRESEQYPDSARLPAVFVISKSPGEAARGSVIEDLESQAMGAHVPLASLSFAGDALSRRLGEVLERQGLTAPEARALLVAWEREFFQTDGIRALTVIPRWLYDSMLPLGIDPQPGELVRVGIIWKEGVHGTVAGEEAHAASGWVPQPAQIARADVEVGEAPLELAPGIPFTVGGDGSIAGLPFGVSSEALARGGRHLLARELSKEPTGLFLFDLEARLATRVATLPGYWDRVHVEHYVSGDGSRVAWTISGEQSSRLTIADLRRRKLLSAGAPRGCSELEVSEDGSQLAWLEYLDSDTEELRVLDLAARELLHVPFEKPRRRTNGETCGGRLSLSADGRRVACAIRSGGGDHEIFLVDLATQTVLNVSQSSAEDSDPCLARGGRLVLFSSDRDRGRSLYLVDVEAGRLTRVVNRHGAGCATWITEDGSQVFFGLEGALLRKDLMTGRELRLLASGTENLYGASIAANGRRAFVEWIERETRRSRGTFVELTAP